MVETKAVLKATLTPKTSVVVDVQVKDAAGNEYMQRVSIFLDATQLEVGIHPVQLPDGEIEETKTTAIFLGKEIGDNKICHREGI